MSGIKWCSAIVITCLILCGCSKQSKEEYGQAGQSLKQAAKATGEALKTDAKVAGQKTENAVHDVKASSANAKDKAQNEKNEHASPKTHK